MFSFGRFLRYPWLNTPPRTPQALVGLERGADCFSDPVFPDDEGLTLLPYTGDDCLTYEGEINKLAVNVAFGRYAKSGPVSLAHWETHNQNILNLHLGHASIVNIP